MPSIFDGAEGIERVTRRAAAAAGLAADSKEHSISEKNSEHEVTHKEIE